MEANSFCGRKQVNKKTYGQYLGEKEIDLSSGFCAEFEMLPSVLLSQELIPNTKN